MAGGLTMDDPVFRAFLGYATVVIGKMIIMSFLTATKRMGKQVFANEEDVAFFKTKKGVITNDADVERVRRAHQNDIENIVPFALLGLLYVATGPSLAAALLHFRIFAAARIAHTVVYLGGVPQPARAITFVVGVMANLSMVLQIIRQAAF